MPAQILDGTSIGKAIREEVAADAAALSARRLTPGLAVVLVGEDPASELYVSNKVKTCRELGMYSEKITLPAETSTQELLSIVAQLNSRDDIDGILIQVPLPKQINTGAVLQAIDPAKDVDGVHPVSAGRLMLAEPGLRPCTPAGIIEMIQRYQIPIAGARAVVLGRSRIVGMPMAMLLLHQNATVTICHSRTADLPAVAREADILVAAMGRMGMIGKDYIKPGAVVVDVGTNKVTNRTDLENLFGDNPKKIAAFEKNGQVLVGDVNPREASEIAGWLTPVPGGVGPLTIAMLMKNTLTAMKARRA